MRLDLVTGRKSSGGHHQWRQEEVPEEAQVILMVLAVLDTGVFTDEFFKEWTPQWGVSCGKSIIIGGQKKL